MPSIKLTYRPGEGTIAYLVTHAHSSRTVATDLHLTPAQWERLRSNPAADPDPELQQRLRCDLDRFGRIAAELTRRAIDFTAADLADEFSRQARESTLLAYGALRCSSLRQQQRQRTLDNYRCALRSFRQFRRGADLPLDLLSAELLEEYESWLRCRGVTQNTSSCYMRALRAIYNHAAARGLTEQRHPFRRVYTGVAPTAKRALTLAEMQRLKALDLSARPACELARDIFLMSYYLRGSSFVDMAYLRKSDLRDGILLFHRRKTGQLLRIAWTAEMQAIVDKYAGIGAGPGDPRLLPFVLGREAPASGSAAYRSACNRVNSRLKAVGRAAGISIALTTYCARHSWASIAAGEGIPVGIISAGLGHDSEATTRIYLASLDTAPLDDANRRLISLI